MNTKRDSTITVYKRSGTDAVPASSTITFTFTGRSVGDTFVVIGDVKYNIHVTEKAPIMPLTDASINLEYWITNNEVYDGKTTSANHTRTINSTNAPTPEGRCPLPTLLPIRPTTLTAR